jgi:hypothetical protein
MYLVGTGIAVGCHRLPIPLDVCPVCNAGIHFSRGYTWIEPRPLLGLCEAVESCHCLAAIRETGLVCPVCDPPAGRAGLLWVGQQYYSPTSFVVEALEMGVSKRIAQVPREFKVGETWVYLAHKHAVTNQSDLGFESGSDESNSGPGIFYAFRPQRIEKLIRKSDATDETIEKLKKRGITAVVVPDGDPDHDPKGE